MSHRLGLAKTVRTFLFVIGAAFAANCSSPKSSSNLGEENKDPAGKDASTSGEKDAEKGAPAMLSNGFTTEISCGDLGKACSVDNKCAGDLTCAGGTCLPDVKREDVVSCVDGCPIDAPVCLLSICVSIDQLACVCSQEKSAKEVALCAGLREGATRLSEGALCTASPEGCEEGLSCLTGEDQTGRLTAGVCKDACEKDSDCKSSCCTVEAGIAGKHCAPRPLCLNACGNLNAVCDGQRNVCCDGLVCAGYAPDASAINPALVGCKLPCTKNDECESKCCVLFNNRDDGICAPAELCP